MPVVTCIDKDARLITYHATGEITIDEMREAFESIFTHPDFLPGMNALCEAKDANFPSVSFSEVRDFAGLISQYSDRRGKGFKVAILVRGNTEFGISSLFGMQLSTLPFKVQVFRNTKEAMDWLA